MLRKIRAGTDKPMLFSGKSCTAIAARASMLIYPIDLKDVGLTSLSVSLYFPEDTGPCTSHATGMQNGFVSGAGDVTTADFTPSKTIQFRAFISGVDVESASPARSVVVLGDSISDGVGATL